MNHKDHMLEDTNRPHEIPEWKHLDVHPYIELLVARMTSHPEEFTQYITSPPNSLTGKTTQVVNPRWTEHCKLIERTKAMWNRKEKWLFNHALRKVRMDEAHNELMTKLLVPKA